jgi:ADP-heptose:LPS heptosyltransferase
LKTRVDIAFRYSALGDLILTSAFVKKHAALKCPLYFVTQKGFKPLVEQSFAFHSDLRVLGFDFSCSGGFVNAVREGFKLGKQILANDQPAEINFYDLHKIPKSLAFAIGLWFSVALSPVQISILSNTKHSFLRQLSIWLGRDLSPKRWIYQEHLNLLENGYNDSQTHYNPELFIPPTHLSDPAKPELPVILLAPAASKWKKEWPASHWIDFIELISLKFSGHLIQVVAPADHRLTSEIEEGLKKNHGNIEWLRNLKTSDLPAIAARAKVCICMNSAWLHLCEASGTVVISLAGPIVDGFGFLPWRKESRSLAVAHLNCRPCSKHGGGNCKLSGDLHHACMKQITPHDVYYSLVELLEPSA